MINVARSECGLGRGGARRPSDEVVARAELHVPVQQPVPAHADRGETLVTETRVLVDLIAAGRIQNHVGQELVVNAKLAIVFGVT